MQGGRNKNANINENSKKEKLENSEILITKLTKEKGEKTKVQIESSLDESNMVKLNDKGSKTTRKLLLDMRRN